MDNVEELHDAKSKKLKLTKKAGETNPTDISQAKDGLKAKK